MNSKILYSFLIALVLTSCTTNYVKQKENFTHYSLKENSENKTVQTTISNYKLKVDAETEKIIATSTDAVLKDGNESTLGNFVCDAMVYSSKKEFKNTTIDLVLMNRGGLRINLPKGSIKVITIFELMPFENELVLVEITGEKLLEGLQTIIEKKHAFLGMHLKVENSKITEATINQLAIEKNKNYTILTSDYLANGGDNFVFLKNPLTLEKCNLKIRDAIINYCTFLTENKQQIIPYTDGRFQLSN